MPMLEDRHEQCRYARDNDQLTPGVIQVCARIPLGRIGSLPFEQMAPADGTAVTGSNNRVHCQPGLMRKKSREQRGTDQFIGRALPSVYSAFQLTCPTVQQWSQGGN